VQPVRDGEAPLLAGVFGALDLTMDSLSAFDALDSGTHTVRSEKRFATSPGAHWHTGVPPTHMAAETAGGGAAAVSV
jgi:hypothetical protein